MAKEARYRRQERRFVIERTMDGVVIRLVDREGKDVTEPILLPHSEALRLGKLLISSAKVGIAMNELMVRKLGEMEHRMTTVEDKVASIENQVLSVEDRLARIEGALNTLLNKMGIRTEGGEEASQPLDEEEEPSDL